MDEMFMTEDQVTVWRSLFGPNSPLVELLAEIKTEFDWERDSWDDIDPAKFGLSQARAKARYKVLSQFEHKHKEVGFQDFLLRLDTPRPKPDLETFGTVIIAEDDQERIVEEYEAIKQKIERLDKIRRYWQSVLGEGEPLADFMTMLEELRDGEKLDWENTEFSQIRWWHAEIRERTHVIDRIKDRPDDMMNQVNNARSQKTSFENTHGRVLMAAGVDLPDDVKKQFEDELPMWEGDGDKTTSEIDGSNMIDGRYFSRMEEPKPEPDPAKEEEESGGMDMPGKFLGVVLVKMEKPERLATEKLLKEYGFVFDENSKMWLIEQTTESKQWVADKDAEMELFDEIRFDLSVEVDIQ